MDFESFGRPSSECWADKLWPLGMVVRRNFWPNCASDFCHKNRMLKMIMFDIWRKMSRVTDGCREVGGGGRGRGAFDDLDRHSRTSEQRLRPAAGLVLRRKNTILNNIRSPLVALARVFLKGKELSAFGSKCFKTQRK